MDNERITYSELQGRSIIPQVWITWSLSPEDYKMSMIGK